MSESIKIAIREKLRNPDLPEWEWGETEHACWNVLWDELGDQLAVALAFLSEPEGQNPEPVSAPSTGDHLLACLKLRAQYPDKDSVDGVSASEDWEAARMEIERLREVVWIYVDPAVVQRKHESVVARCVPD